MKTSYPSMCLKDDIVHSYQVHRVFSGLGEHQQVLVVSLILKWINLNTFLKFTQELTRCDETINETHQAVIVLNSLPKEFNNVKDVIACARDDVTYKR